jgi:hypothetical protein
VTTGDDLPTQAVEELVNSMTIGSVASPERQLPSYMSTLHYHGGKLKEGSEKHLAACTVLRLLALAWRESRSVNLSPAGTV